MNKTASTILFATLVVAASQLTACSPVGRGLQRMGTMAHQEMAALDDRMRGYLDTEEATYAQPKPVQRSYCYRTWGEIACYKTPIAGEDHRLIGKQEPAPVFEENEYPYPAQKPPVVVVEGPKGPKVIAAPDEEEVMVSEVLPPERQAAMEAMSDPEPYTGELTYEVPESALRQRESIPKYRRPRNLIPVFENIE